MTQQITIQWISPFQAMPPIKTNTNSVHVILHDEKQGTMRGYFDYQDLHWKPFFDDQFILTNVIAWFPIPPDPVVVPAEPDPAVGAIPRGSPNSAIRNPNSEINHGQT